MFCPNCRATLNTVNLDNQIILHCLNCAGSFFQENGINRISLSSAQKLAHEKQTDEIFAGEKKCPKDKTVLKPQTNQENIPADVTLLFCSTCHGIFAYPDDLIKFKQAQEAKINYFKFWQIPLPSLKAVLVISFFALILSSIFTQYNSFINYFSQQASAQDLIKKIYLSKSPPYLFISFKTQSPLRSKIIFEDKTTNEKIEKIINHQLSTFHQLTTKDLDLNNEIWYQIVLFDKNNKEIRSQLKKL